jgi:hypothetical protein
MFDATLAAATCILAARDASASKMGSLLLQRGGALVTESQSRGLPLDMPLCGAFILRQADG